MYSCHICNQKCKTKASLSTHYKKVEKLSPLEQSKNVAYTVYGKNVVDTLVEEYKIGLYSIHTLKQEGYDLRTYITLLGIKRTSSEERLTDRYKNKYRSSILNKYGVEHISQAQSIKKKKIETIVKNYGSEEAYYSQTVNNMNEGYKQYIGTEKHLLTIEKCKQTFKRLYNVINPSQVPFIREKAVQSNKERFSKLSKDELREITRKARESVSSRGGYSSKLEIRLQKILDGLKISYEANKNLFGYNYDIVFDNIIIEINGVYWHAKPNKYSSDFLIMNGLKAQDVWEKDERKQSTAIENGYKTFVIWEDTLNSMSDNELIQWVQNIQEITYDRENYQY